MHSAPIFDFFAFRCARDLHQISERNRMVGSQIHRFSATLDRVSVGLDKTREVLDRVQTGISNIRSKLAKDRARIQTGLELLERNDPAEIERFLETRSKRPHIDS